MSAVAEIVPTVQEASIPAGWTLATIEGLVGDGGVFVDGDWVESKDQDPEGDVRLIQLADIGDGEYRDKSARFLTHAKAVELGCTFLIKGDVLIARMPDPLGRACIFPGDSKPAVTVVDVAVVRSAAGEFDHRWLMYFVNAPAFRSAVASMQSGSTRKRISRGNLAKIALPVPPLDQQKRIVAEIEKQFSRLDEAVSNLKRVKANLKRYKAAVLKAAVEGRLVETEAEIARREGRSYESGEQLLQRILETRRIQWQGRSKYKEPAAPDTTDLPELPEGWVWATVDQLLTSLRNGLSKKPEDSEPGIPILRISAVRPLELDTMDRRFYRPQSNERVDDYKLEEGDVLFVRYNGTKELVGVCAFVNMMSGALLYPDKLIRGRVVSEQQVLPSYLAIAANVGRSRQHIDELIKTTAGQQGIAGGEIKQMPIPLPPYPEQHRIVTEVDRRLSLLRETEAQVHVNLRRSEGLRNSVLARAFTIG